MALYRYIQGIFEFYDIFLESLHLKSDLICRAPLFRSADGMAGPELCGECPLEFTGKY